MKSCLIGLDIGTSKLSAVALAPESGKLLAVASARNRAGLAPSAPDAAEQDAAALLNATIGLLKALARNPKLAKVKPAALGVTGQMHGLALADRDGRPLSPLITWQDGRGNRIKKSSKKSWVAEFNGRVGARALAACGCAPATGYGGVTLLRLAEEGGLPANATALTIHALLVRRLCGRAVLDPSDAASWGLFDVRGGTDWIPGIAEALKLPPALLPEVAPTGSCAGALLPQWAKASGLPAGLPVAVALGDNQASFLGSATRPAETLLINLGTGGQMSVSVKKFLRIAGLDTRPLIKGCWLLVGASLCGGRAYEILKKFFEQVGRGLFSVKSSPDLYEAMNRLAAGADADCGGLNARTLFDGSRLDPELRGSLEGLSSANFTPANLARAVIRGMVEELADFYERARAAGAAASCLRGAGNAVRNNPVVRAELERRLGMKLTMPPCAEEAAVGAALAGGVAAGVFPNWASTSKNTKIA